MENIPSLDGLRALAVLAVIAQHFGASVDGPAGVTVFFALSGFLITSLLLHEHHLSGRISTVGFYRRRARRLLPASTLAVLLTLIVVVVKGLPKIGRQAQAALTYWANWERYGSHVAYGQATFAPLTHFWSLAVEEQFYVALPLLAVVTLWFGHRVGGGRWVFLGACSAGFVASALFARSLAANPMSYYDTRARVCEILIGSLLAFALFDPGSARATARAPGRAQVLTALGYGSLVTLVLLIVLTTSPHLLISLLSIGVIVGRPGVLAIRPLVQIGKVSYGLYLFHPLALIVANGSAIVACLLTAGVTVVSYLVVERPLRFQLSWPQAGRIMLAGSVVALLAASVMTGITEPTRFTPVASAAARVVARVGATAAPSATHPAAPDTTATHPTVPDATVAKSPAVPTTAQRPLRISTAGDSSSPALGQALRAWADVDPNWEFVPAPDSVYADWEPFGLGRGGCPLVYEYSMMRVGRDHTDSFDMNTVTPGDVGCDWHQWIPQALAVMHLDVLVVSDNPSHSFLHQIEGAWCAPGDPCFDQVLIADMQSFEQMAADFGTAVMWVAYPDIRRPLDQRADPRPWLMDDPKVVDALHADIATRPLFVDLRSMTRDADQTNLYLDNDHFDPAGAAQAAALIVARLPGDPGDPG
jgi:peptidoglycan/LPS O-acetylase OafA/YrhL